LKNLVRITAIIAYIPIFGWVFAILAQRKDSFVVFHLRQSIGLVVFLVAVFLGWLGSAYLIAFIPYAMVVGMALFTLVITAFFFCLFAWILGIYNALKGRMVFLPIFGKLSARFLT
jgi:uncharacterized membrane protein